MHDISTIRIPNGAPGADENDQITVYGDRQSVTIASGDSTIMVTGKEAVGGLLRALSGAFGLPVQSQVTRTVDSAIRAIAEVEDAHARPGGGGPQQPQPNRNIGIGAQR
jgi:hypothetical protein